MRQKIIAVALGLGLVGIAAIGAYASQDSVNTLADTPTATGTVGATDTATATEQPTDTPEATETPESSETSMPEATTTPRTPEAGTCEDDRKGDHQHEADHDHEGDDEASGTATATATATAVLDTNALSPAGGCGDDAGERDVKGIPSDNPNHHADDGDGVCQKGETAVKTTPSGVRVNVPCHAAEHGNGSHEKHGD